MRLRSKVAVITGAALTNGFGFASARAFLREGAQVVLTDINDAEIHARGRELTDAGYDVLALAHDVTQEGSVARNGEG